MLLAPEKKRELNAYLAGNEMATLDDPVELMKQLAYLIDQDEDRFCKFLLKVEPEKRRMAYDVMSPFLRFKPKPIEDYLAQGGRMAESDRLATMTADGTLKPYKPGHIGLMERANLALTEEWSLGHDGGVLRVICYKCTREQSFRADGKLQAIKQARNQGWEWVFGQRTTEGIDPTHAVCPECVRKQDA